MVVGRCRADVADESEAQHRTLGAPGESSERGVRISVEQERVDQGVRPRAQVEGLLPPSASHVRQAVGGLVRRGRCAPLTWANVRPGRWTAFVPAARAAH